MPSMLSSRKDDVVNGDRGFCLNSAAQLWISTILQVVMLHIKLEKPPQLSKKSQTSERKATMTFNRGSSHLYLNCHSTH